VTRWRGWPWVGWLILASPALGQLGLLAVAIAGRFGHPYDLEWMEGGLLHHAQRIGDGDGIYQPPSVDFIPYLYTPLYPGLLAVAGSLFGLSYQLGRAISIAALFGIGVVAWGIIRGRGRGPAPTAGALVALGLFAAGYPYVEGWYDLVRADTLFLLMVTAGIALAYRTARTGAGVAGHGRTAAAAAVLALAFFCKQTGVLFVAAGGVLVLCANWRRAPIYVVTAAVVGLGGTWLLQRATNGWFWTYAYEIHQAHDWNLDRYWMTFDELAWTHLPVETIVLQYTAVIVLLTWVVRREVPAEARTFLIWLFVALVSTVVGAIGFGTEFAHRNAFMPALLHRAIAAGAAIPALARCVAVIAEAGGDAARPARRIGHGVAAVAAAALAGQLVHAWWTPARLTPTDRDRRGGDALIARIAEVDGEVWVPSHPWYAHLAGKRMYVHRMGVKDVTVRKPRPIAGLEDALRDHRFAAVFLDNRDLHQYGELPPLVRYYHEEDALDAAMRPRTVTGARNHPDSVWVPIGPPRLPPGARVVFDFEDVAAWTDGWDPDGAAWGRGPVDRAIGRQALRRAGGRRWATSIHGGDAPTGTVTSPPFELDGGRLLLRLGGGTEPALRVELIVDGQVVRQVTKPSPPSDRFADVTVDVADLRGRTARLRLVDDATGAWGHLNVDEIWIAP
jgi:hypothetical protein